MSRIAHPIDTSGLNASQRSTVRTAALIGTKEAYERAASEMRYELVAMIVPSDNEPLGASSLTQEMRAVARCASLLEAVAFHVSADEEQGLEGLI